MFLKVTDSCLQFWGGMGFTEEVIEIHDMMTFLEKSFKYVVRVSCYYDYDIYDY